MSVIPLSAPRPGIRWISVADRVPDDRRPVLAWGRYGITLVPHEKLGFLGQTRFNPSKGGGTWGAEQRSWRSLLWAVVTHWAEIEGPE